MNGLIYLVLLTALVCELFVNGDSVMDFIYVFFSILMMVVLTFSLRRVVRYLKHLNRRGVLPATKTIIVQLTLVTLAATFNVVSYFAEFKFND